MSEGDIVREIRLALGRDPDLALWKNSTGTAIQDFGAGGYRNLRYGLAKGSADLIGVLAPHGRFVALEVKTYKGRIRPEQTQFLELVRRLGGVAAVVRSSDEAMAVIAAAKRGGAP